MHLCSLFQGTRSVHEEEAHIKDAMSRILVEMIKREWPQQWPQLLSELSQLANIGVSTFFFVSYLNWSK